MKTTIRKLLKKLIAATVAICFIGMQVPNVFADDPCGCAAAETLCYDNAATDLNTCQANCVVANRECLEMVPIGCLLVWEAYPICLAAGLITCTALATACMDTCNNNYDGEIQKCNDAYTACRAPEGCH